MFQVVEGELQNLKGKVESVEGEKVTIAPDLEGFQVCLEIFCKQDFHEKTPSFFNTSEEM